MIPSRTTRTFRQAFASLPNDVRRQAQRAYQLFRRDPRHPSLRFKKVDEEAMFTPCELARAIARWESWKGQSWCGSGLARTPNATACWADPPRLSIQHPTQPSRGADNGNADTLPNVRSFWGGAPRHWRTSSLTMSCPQMRHETGTKAAGGAYIVVYVCGRSRRLATRGPGAEGVHRNRSILTRAGRRGGAHIDSHVCVPESCRNATDGVADIQTNVCATREAI